MFLARDATHDRNVAIKVLHPEVAAGFSTKRFLREIQLLAHLQHPHILPLYDSGEAAGLPYYVMPYVAGESLRERLTRDAPLPLAVAVRFATETAAALDYAHRDGVVHRDIKPENILLSDNHVIVADFGIARAAAHSADEKLTLTSVTIGTPAYMSPEQALGDAAIDGRSDIYSLGCVVFEMLAGEPPFTGPNAAATIGRRFAKAAPRISTVVARLPVSVDNAIASALSLSPDDRPQTAREFSAMLADETPPSFASRRSRLVPAAIGILAIVSMAVFFTLSTGGRAAPDVAQTRSSGTSAHHPHIPDPIARDLYLKGKASWETPGAESNLRADSFFRKAVERDSLYTEAYAGIAQVHAGLGIGNIATGIPRAEFEQARYAAMRALAIDSTNAEANVALATVQMFYEYDWTAAEKSLARAQASDPGYEGTYRDRSIIYSWLGKFDSANAVAREAAHIAPTVFRYRGEIGRTLIQLHRFSEARLELAAEVAEQPQVPNSRLHHLLAEALVGEGRAAEAVLEIEKAQREAPSSTRVAGYRVAVYAAAGKSGDARRLADSLIAASDRSFVPALDIAVASAGLMDRDRTIAWLERAYTDRTLRPIMRDPVFDFVKSDARYVALLRKMNLSP